MNLQPHLTSLNFALAGLLCACGPIVIHLLNRRRYRRVRWAAMEFLLEAFRRERRILRIRDWIVLALRTASVLFFGLALARPYFSSTGQIVDSSSPRHVIVLIDNSLSMAYRTTDGTLLARAQQQAQRLIDALPEGSSVTVLPTCGEPGNSATAHRSKAEALQAIQAIQIADSSAPASQCVRLAAASLGAASPLPDQVFLMTDMQERNWPQQLDQELVSQLPSFSICDVSLPEYENTWVADLRVRDGVADLTSPATILTVIEHRSAKPRQVQVTFTVDAEIVGTRRLDLAAGHATRELSFEHTFANVDVAAGEAAAVPVCVSISEDRLPLDDQRTLIVPVVAALPVVFIDQFSDQQEDVRRGRLGETRHVRQLLAPVLADEAAPRSPINAQHVGLKDVTRSVLAQARLVVMAGVADPGNTVSLLREYVQQGGPLFIAAGGEFDPVAWTTAAWLDGDGLLPAPLAPRALGVLPEDSPQQVEPFFLSFASLASSPHFRLAGLSESELQDLYSEPLFFKAIEIQLSEESQQQLIRSEQRRLRRRAAASEAMEGRATDWLIWKSPIRADQSVPAAVRSTEATPDPSAAQAMVCARFTNPGEDVFLAERTIGRGRVLFVSTGLLASWNTVAQTNAVVMWDHILRGLIHDTLPRRNFFPQPRIALPIPQRDKGVTVRLERPGAAVAAESVDIGFVGQSEYGVVVEDAWQRGVYRLTAHGAERTASQPVWKLAVAVNGDEGESQLQSISGQQREQLMSLAAVTFSHGSQLLSAGPRASSGRPLWRWLLLVVLALLLMELGILIYPWLRLVGSAAARWPANET